MRKIFISYIFTDKDERFALEFKRILKEYDMDGYMAEKQPEYKLLIDDKIKGEISASGCLVAIITTNSYASASVHEEIGFAMGKGVEILLMIEESKELEGVLTHGRQPRSFTDANFAVKAEEIACYIHEKIPEKTNHAKISMNDYIMSRNLSKQSNDNFCKNSQTDVLTSEINPGTTHNKIPFILFSAWPHNHVDIPVQSPKITKFLESYKNIQIEKNNVHFLDNYDERDIDSLIFYNNPLNTNQGTHYKLNPEITRYLELQTNGFLEQGISKKIISRVEINGILIPSLNHCWLTGAFWAFLKFARMYYEFNGIDEKINVALSVRNSVDLVLHGFGGRINNTYWAEPDGIDWDGEKPSTKQPNIHLRRENLDLQQMTDEFIKSEVRKMSDRIAYAYNLELAMCYNDDGSLNWKLMAHYSRRL